MNSELGSEGSRRPLASKITALLIVAIAALALVTCWWPRPSAGPYPAVFSEQAPEGATASGGDNVLEFTNFVRVQVPDGEGFSSSKEFFYEGWLIEVPTTRWTMRGPDREMVMIHDDGVGNGMLRFDGHLIEGNQFRVDREWGVHVLKGAPRAPQLEELLIPESE